MAIVAGMESSKTVIQKILSSNKNQEIISAGIWIDKHSAKRRENALIYHFSREGNSFKEVNKYKQKISIFYKKMKFYALGRHLKEGEVFWTKMYMDDLSKNKIISVLAPIYKNHNYIGVANLNIKFSMCENYMFASLVNSKEKYFVLVDKAGNFVMSSDEISEKSADSSLKTLEVPFLKELLQKSVEPKDEEFTENLSQEYPELKNKKVENIAKVNRTITMLEDDPIFHEPSVVALYEFTHTKWRMLIAIPNHVIFKQTNNFYQKIFLLTIFFALITAFITYNIIKKTIVSPLISISEQIQAGGIDSDTMIHTKEKGEIKLVVHKLNARNIALKEAHKKEVASEKLLLQQSKMAAMGEMLDAVAHQWKQPLNALSMYVELIGMDYKDELLDETYIKDFQKDVQLQIRHMTETLSTFRNFFRPDGKMQNFHLKEIIDDVLLLAKDELIKNNIEVTTQVQDDFEIYGSKNELRHLILNLISNAKDAFEDNAIKERFITVKLFKEEKKKVLEVHDNAGGVPRNIINTIFKANVTTKEEGKGTGIGLYMSTQIAQKHHAQLSVANINNGACFRVLFSQGNLKLIKD
jgi:C4-dicarboxylate-specific signal transduction histidine kinase